MLHSQYLFYLERYGSRTIKQVDASAAKMIISDYLTRCDVPSDLLAVTSVASFTAGKITVYELFLTTDQIQK